VRLILYTVNLHFLPENILSAIGYLNAEFITEIRLREGRAVIIQYKGEYKYLGGFGITESVDKAITCNGVAEVIRAVTEGSVYAFTEQLNRGFIAADGGIRIGLCGEYVMQGREVVSLKNISSLNIRLPHVAAGCADFLFEKIYDGKLKSTLIFSPPGFGKTTILRELTNIISTRLRLNVLVFDERNEISATRGGVQGFSLGDFCDVSLGADKLTGLANSLRSMNPQVIVTDELYGDRDREAIQYALSCGIKVIASTQLCDIDKLKHFTFERYVRLTGIGKPYVIYDKDFNYICDCGPFGGAGDNVIQRKAQGNEDI